MTTKKDSRSEPQDDGMAAVENTAAELQRITDEAEAKGFYGEAVDETPRENYTVSGVTEGKSTPENGK